MAANTDPIYSKVGNLQWITDMTTANANADLTSGTSYLLFTADATNGSYVREIRIKPNPAVSTSATVIRVWINNGSSTGTASNSSLFTEFTFPAVTASSTAASLEAVIALGFALDPGYKIYITLGASPGSGKFTAVCVGGKY